MKTSFCHHLKGKCRAVGRFENLKESSNVVQNKDFRAFWVALVRRMTAANTLACLFAEWLCYVLLHSSYVLSTRIRLHIIEVINEIMIFQKKIKSHD